MINEKLINIAVEKMRTITDPEHSLGHTLDVVDYAKEILTVVDANQDVVIIAAYWHDVGRTVKQDGHELMSGILLKEEMIKLKYDSKFIEDCFNAVIYHKWNASPITIEGNIVRDADKLGFLGKRRWENCMNNNYPLDSIISVLPLLRNKYLYFEKSKIIYDRDIIRINKLLEQDYKKLFLTKQ